MNKQMNVGASVSGGGRPPEFEPIAKLLREVVELAVQIENRLHVLITVHRQAHWLRNWEQTAGEMEWIFRAVAEGIERKDTRATSVVRPIDKVPDNGMNKEG
jgi:hypothetical protein